MYRRFYNRCLVIAGLAGATFVSNSFAQEHLIDGLEEKASRVIQLRTKIEAELEEAVEEVSSRSERLAENPLATLQAPTIATTAQKLVGAPNIAFEEIGESKIAEEPIAPATNSPSSIGPRVAANVAQDESHVVAEVTPSQITFEPKKNQVPAFQASHARPVTTLMPLAAPIRSSSAAPVAVIDVKAPEFVNVNEAATIQINIRNPGKTLLQDMKLIATLPANVKVESKSGTIVDNDCLFKINSLQPGESRQMAMSVVTDVKQPLGIETALVMSNRSQIQVDIREPKLVVSIEGPQQANIGTTATHVITVANTGDGIARQVNLIADIPAALKIIQKDGFESPKSLRPGEKAQARIVTIPQAPGGAQVSFSAEGVSCIAEASTALLKVTQPELRIDAIGPDMNFVDRDGIYTIKVDNPGEVDIHNVSVEFTIPEGLKITTISRQARMNGEQRTLTWEFDKVTPQTEELIQLKAVATNEGEKLCRIRVASDETNGKEVALKTLIATRANLSIQMQNIGGPVKVGTETTFIVVVENRGNNVANNLEIEVQLPKGMRPANPKDGVADEQANAILFADSDLQPGKTREFRFTAIGVEKGEHIVRSALQTAGSKQRIIVENSVYVYEPAQARVSESLSPLLER